MQYVLTMEEDERRRDILKGSDSSCLHYKINCAHIKKEIISPHDVSFLKLVDSTKEHNTQSSMGKDRLKALEIGKCDQVRTPSVPASCPNLNLAHVPCDVT